MKRSAGRTGFQSYLIEIFTVYTEITIHAATANDYGQLSMLREELCTSVLNQHSYDEIDQKLQTNILFIFTFTATPFTATMLDALFSLI